MPTDTITDVIGRNLAGVRDRIAAACESAGRPDDVTLVAVVKYADLAWVRALVELGVRDFGEARPQQLAERVPQFPGDVRWHLIGSLQRNKAGLTLGAIGSQGMIHSVDSRRLLDRIATVAADGPLPKRLPAPLPKLLLQVNVTGEASKHGVSPDEVGELVDAGVPIAGLMTMAALDGDPAEAFAALAALQSQHATERQPLAVLSMGMSGDLEPAIAAGATHVRVGSALFEGLA